MLSVPPCSLQAANRFKRKYISKKLTDVYVTQLYILACVVVIRVETGLGKKKKERKNQAKIKMCNVSRM